MKSILVPIDFSETSHHAFLYARSLAEQLKASIKVVHIYNEVVQLEQPMVMREGVTRSETLLEHLTEFVQKPIPESSSEVETAVNIEAEAISAINVQPALVKLTQEENHLMTVMGTTGAHNAYERMVGSISTAVAQKANGPVILVPKEAKINSFQNILFASNYESADSEIIEDIMYMAELFESTVHFVHIGEPGDHYDEQTKTTLFEKLFEEQEPRFSFEMTTIQGKKIAEGLSAYAQTHDIDLVVLVNRDRGLLSNLFQRSITQRMGLYTSLPLMVFHLKV